MRRLALITALALASPAAAQDTSGDVGFLTGFLQDSLSDAGRTVTIEGFAGALSSRATVDRLTIADDTGIWLTVDGITLDWSRSSLLSGALLVEEFSADQITLTRLPVTDDPALPAPEAGGFALPDLPVSIDIEQVSAARITLGEDVLGQPVEGSLSASLQLAGGAGRMVLDLLRTDAGPAGAIRLDAGFDNQSRELSVDLTAREAEGGIVTSLLQLPGLPAADFSLIGRGTLDAFAADITLATDGADRLTGEITLGTNDAGAQRLETALQGNLAPLLAPEQVDFFGTSVALTLAAERAADGRVTVEDFVLAARSLQLQGSAAIAADGLPESVSITGVLADPDGSPVLLPFGGTTLVDAARFELRSDLAGSGDWRGALSIDGLSGDFGRASQLRLSGSGGIARLPDGRSLDGTFRITAAGLTLADPALQQALGRDFDGTVTASYLEGDDAVALSDLRLTGAGLDLSGALMVGGPTGGFPVSGTLRAVAADLSRFAPLADLPLAGRGTVTLTGSAGVLSGLIDGTLALAAEGLKVGITPLDRLLAGTSSLTLSVLRDESGTDLRSLDLEAGPLGLAASGKLASAGSALRANIRLADLGAALPGWEGAVNLDASFDGTADLGRISVTGTGTGLAAGTAPLDRLLAGESTLAARVTLRDGRLVVDNATLATPQLSLAAVGDPAATDQTLAVEATLADLGLLVDGVRGPLRVAGQVVQDSAGLAVDLSGQGPGQVDATLNGQIAPDFAAADLALVGSGQAGLANLLLAPRSIEGPVRFDLALSGPLVPASLSGRVTLSDGRLVDPNLGFAVEGIAASAVLGRGRAAVDATALLSTGGSLRLEGPVSLSPPFDADLSIALDGLRLFDPELYDATASGSVQVAGPLTGGASVSGSVVLAEAELRVPDSTIAGAGSIPEIIHLAEPADVRRTRVRAGLLETDAGSPGSGSGAAFGLDLTISAPNRVFLRGRGLDAELGGEIRLTGTTADIVPFGAFSLIRGRLDILGRRLVLSQADLALEGSFVPVLTISASTESDGITSFVRIEGAADDPAVTFTSTPELPQEDVIARLLFDRGLESITVFQAVQLANAVAVLAGRSGVGIINRLRTGFGFDDLDVTTAEDGSTALTVGKYLTENIYTEVEVGQAGQSRINLNLDVRPGVTVKGRVGDDGETGLGIFVEGDY
ncbi:MAG: hypothetical protein B7Z10_06235 [Rhodobacterales bacterium 32-66-7]|nr:MAG: hypothetical protein B7Z10_06235 [Rhodobacterales bacterium 32-66-7]